MDLKDFMQLHPPATKTSRFEVFKAELRTLQKNKYTIEQMLEFLQANDLTATRSALYAYLKKKHIMRTPSPKDRKPGAADAGRPPEQTTPSETTAPPAADHTPFQISALAENQEPAGSVDIP